MIMVLPAVLPEFTEPGVKVPFLKLQPLKTRKRLAFLDIIIEKCAGDWRFYDTNVLKYADPFAFIYITCCCLL